MEVGMAIVWDRCWLCLACSCRFSRSSCSSTCWRSRLRRSCVRDPILDSRKSVRGLEKSAAGRTFYIHVLLLIKDSRSSYCLTTQKTLARIVKQVYHSLVRQHHWFQRYWSTYHRYKVGVITTCTRVPWSLDSRTNSKAHDVWTFTFSLHCTAWSGRAHKIIRAVTLWEGWSEKLVFEYLNSCGYI